MSTWYVYICKSKAGYYYVGMTSNPNARLERHNLGTGSKMAIDQGTFDLLYVSSPFSDKSSARKREIQIKGWSRAKKEKLIRGEYK